MGKSSNKAKKRGKKVVDKDKVIQEQAARIQDLENTIAINEQRYRDEVERIKRSNHQMPESRTYLGPTESGCFDNPVMPDYRNANEVLGQTIQRLKECINKATVTMDKVAANYENVDGVATTKLD